MYLLLWLSKFNSNVHTSKHCIFTWQYEVQSPHSHLTSWKPVSVFCILRLGYLHVYFLKCPMHFSSVLYTLYIIQVISTFAFYFYVRGKSSKSPYKTMFLNIRRAPHSDCVIQVNTLSRSCDLTVCRQTGQAGAQCIVMCQWILSRIRHESAWILINASTWHNQNLQYFIIYAFINVSLPVSSLTKRCIG
jgi:hypothetical protein